MRRLWAFVLRRLMGRLRIGDDILRHLSAFQRLGARLEAVPPLEMLPVGARTVLRAIRTRGAADIRPDWLWPYWLEQQLDPSSPAFTPRGHLPVMQNVTHRNWTMIGNPWSPWEAIVDPTGLISASHDTWSLDWWVHAGGVWHHPTRAGEALSQTLLDDAPVVETALRLPAGVVVQRAYAVETVPELVAVEVVNDTAEPVEVALAIRPYNPEGLAVIEELSLQDAVVHVDRRRGLLLPRSPDRWALSTFAEGDSALMVDEPTRPKTSVHDDAGLAQAAFVYELPAGAILRAAMPIAGRGVATRWPMPWRRRMRRVVPPVDALPDAASVAGDWTARLDRGLQVTLPDERLQRAVEANRAYMLLLHDPGDITAGPTTYHRFWFRDAAYQIAALDRWGFHAEAADVLRTYPGRQRRDGFFYSQWREWDANGAALWTIAEHQRLTGDDALVVDLADAVARGARWIAATCEDDRGKVPAAHGLLPPGVSAEHFGPFDYYYWDDLWCWRGLLDATDLLRHAGRDDEAAAAAAAAERLEATLQRAFQRDAERLGRSVIPAGPTRAIDAGMIGSLAACYPLGLLAATDRLIAGTAEAVRERFTVGPAFYQGISHTGLGTYLTLQLAFVELFAGDPRAFERLGWLLDVATATWTWPEAVHPQLPGGCMGDGHHGWMAADLLNVVRLLLVREVDDGLALLTLLPPGWTGRPVAVRHAATHHGHLDYDLTWEGDVPVLRWELDRAGVPLTAPGLDPGWSTTERRGEARLAAVR